MKENPLPAEGAFFEPAYRVAYLIAAYIKDTLTPAEREELDEWVGASKENLLLFEELTDEKNLHQSLKWFHKLDVENARRRVWEKMEAAAIKPLWRRWLPYVAAASVILVAGLLLWRLADQKRSDTAPVAAAPVQHDAAPGSHKAVLTLANGQQIGLDTAANGTLIQQGKANIVKENGLLAYHDNSTGAEAVYNTLTVPRGGQYSLQLADGSRVWLNAASTLRFPVAFNGPERAVELNGEGYFEIAKNPSQPFRVKANGSMVEVIGTHFNVTAYNDEGRIKTTLVEGRVRVSSNNNSILLQPGQQAIVREQGRIQLNKNADVEAAVAWQKGMFLFRDAPMEEVGRQLSRWYNVEVVYRDKINHHFNAPIPRHIPLTKALQLLEGPNRVQFTIEGNKLIVSK